MSIDTERRDALVERLFEATIGTLELFSIHLGWRLGLYRALADAGPLTPGGLAAAAGIDERYAQEWLEQQAVAGFVAVDDDTAPAADRRFSLPAGHAEVLVDEVSLAHVVPFAPMVVGVAGALPEVVEAYRSGGGVPYLHYGPDFRDGQGAINRPAFANDLDGWMAALADVTPTRVADVGCGQGWSTVALAQAFPAAEVWGFDSDEASIRDAKRAVDAAGGAPNARFAAIDGADLADHGLFDLVCMFEALHDMARPVEALDACRRALGDGGTLLVVDERVAPSFTSDGDQVERLMYGWSVSHCLPAARAEEPSAALGTALRPGVVADLGRRAGFASVEELPIENDFFRFYRFRP